MIWIASALSLGAIVLAVMSLAMAVLRKWELARRTARWASSLAFAVLALCAATLLLLIFAPRVLGSLLFQLTPATEPAERARVLAQAISELVNSSAFAVPVLVLALPIWLIARNRLKATAAGRAASRDSGSAN
jgi:hypothetical protein